MKWWSALAGKPPGPIIVGGTGGSGTRVVQTLLERAGIYMGDDLNISKDAMNFEPWLDETINPVLRHAGKLDFARQDIGAALWDERVRALAAIAEAHRQSVPPEAAGWGWKNPRSIFVLPFIHALFPKMRFVHVVRDGRDMAFSDNQNQPRKHYEALLGTPPADAAEAAILLWAKANTEVRRWGERVLKDRYRVLRMEDLCADPRRQGKELLGWLGVNGEPAAEVVMPPASLGRWRQQPPESGAKLTALIREALVSFGYEQPGISSA